MRFALPISVLAALLALATACSDKPSNAECKKLLEHTIELEFRESGSVPADLDKQIATIAATANSEFMEQCLGELPRTRVLCGIEAKNKAAQQKCDGE